MEINNMATVNKDTLGFLKDLKKNNNRDWFGTNKDRYTEAHANLIAFADALLAEMNKHDQIETPSGKKSVIRIYKDVRFSKEKVPYNTHWSGSFKRATNKLRGGYYFRLEPGNSFLACGFWGPNPDDIKRIRQDIDANYAEWKKLLTDKSLTETFGTLQGEQLGSAPRGYAKNHPAIDLLRYKQFILRYPLTEEQILSGDFVQHTNDVYKKMRPFLNFMSEVLTTDGNGVSIV
jgi:uncharacterized protein (TIGR02453 family)